MATIWPKSRIQPSDPQNLLGTTLAPAAALPFVQDWTNPRRLIRTVQTDIPPNLLLYAPAKPAYVWFQWDPNAPPRTRQSLQQMASMLNSLVASGQLVQTAAGAWKLVPQ